LSVECHGIPYHIYFLPGSLLSVYERNSSEMKHSEMSWISAKDTGRVSGPKDGARAVLMRVDFLFSSFVFDNKNILQAATKDEDDIRDAITFLLPDSRSQMSHQMDGGWAEQRGLV
jgi:hypothetical protein